MGQGARRYSTFCPSNQGNLTPTRFPRRRLAQGAAVLFGWGMTNEVRLRAVEDGDLPVFFTHQLDPVATRMAAFPSREHEAFMAHWAKIRATPQETITRTILYQGQVAGNIGSWVQDGHREVGYWLGREYWGRGIASAALGLLLAEVKVRPIQAHVVSHNLPSIRVLQKGGFVVTGREQFTDATGAAIEELILTLAAPN
jgi:RimJ/RimL family protein N-acetyltransferase